MDSGPTSWFSHNRSAFRKLILGSSTPVRRGGSFKLQNRTQTSWSFAQTCKHSWATYWIIFFLACQLLQTWPMLSFLKYAVCKTQLTSWKIDSCSSRIIIFWFCWSEKLQLCVPKMKLYRLPDTSPTTHSQFIYLTQRQRISALPQRKRVTAFLLSWMSLYQNILPK